MGTSGCGLGHTQLNCASSLATPRLLTHFRLGGMLAVLGNFAMAVT